MNQVWIADLRVGRLQRRQRHAVARRDARHRVAALHRVVVRCRCTAALAGNVNGLSRVNQVRIADLRIGCLQRRQRHAVARCDARHRVATLHRVVVRRRCAAALAGDVNGLSRMNQIRIADLRVGRLQRRQRHAESRCNAGHRVTTPDRVGTAPGRRRCGCGRRRRRRCTAALAGNVNRLPRMNQIRIADLRVGRLQRRQRHAESRCNAGHRVTTPDRVGTAPGRRRCGRRRRCGSDWRLAPEHGRFFIAAADQALQNAPSGMNVHVEILLGLGIVAAVQIIQQGRITTRPDVVGQADQCIKLALGQGNMHVAAYGILVLDEVILQNRLSLCPGDVHARIYLGFSSHAGVPVTDRPYAHSVLISIIPESFILLDQIHAVLADGHAGRRMPLARRLRLDRLGMVLAASIIVDRMFRPRVHFVAVPIGNVNGLANPDQIRIVDLRIGFFQSGQRHAVAGGNFGKRVTTLDGVFVRIRPLKGHGYGTDWIDAHEIAPPQMMASACQSRRRTGHRVVP